ncbi:MAG: PIN domain-containing protein [bacterium]|nr:PIN domain-containing protein [bacterium]
MKLLDTNILIYALNPKSPLHERALSILSQSDQEFALSALSYFEIFLGALKEHREQIRFFLDYYHVFRVTPEIAYRGAVLMVDHNKSSRSLKIDSLIAATAMEHDVPFMTNNPKDFEWIKGLKVESL